ncbi:filamentous hemagglutinin N-terminal domain-containing protein [Calothrix anomala FACHB-343]|uniref:Filamentous hemagglutinin N-terminal domain-containing protein n=3 Tax=Calotrichaceae TaxID=2661849 RepID=A0ABR8AE20_9CYAN|nr:filamentous hemagglutinin N-terminal domain-containing protein [Calothrix parietina FACHB-288]MBD2227330.1 filamentous hemagglutinin N-terminal domain-containing protein [Calothrix anomala FACHB-343]
MRSLREVEVSLISPAQAQITPDNTLGAESSRLTPNVLINNANADQIDGGAQRGSNLFHSFTQFNINNGQRVYFGNPAGVQNILTRVTGGQASNILGTLGVNGNANLFLINPNGILFGQNARLDVRGSFVGTTANAIQFGNQGIFSATNPQAAPLLTINPSALLFNQINQNATIQNNSIAPAGQNLEGFEALGLRVADGNSLLLVGGNVSMDGGQLNAFDGRVELGGLAEVGNVNLLFDGDNLSLGFPENVNRADVSLNNRSAVFVEGFGGGNIAVNARDLEILGGSILSGGIGQGLGTPETVAGDINLNATGEIKVAGTQSQVRNLVRLGSQGNAGNITIDSGSLSLQHGAFLRSSTFGQGNAGNVTVNAKDAVSLVDAAIISTVAAGGVGQGGNININTATLSLLDSAQLLTNTRGASGNQPAGRGDAGNVNVKATGTVDIAGQKNDVASGIRSGVNIGTVGNGGNITIDSGSLSLRDGAQLAASTYGQGNAGNVTVSAKDAVSLVNAAILSTVEAGGVGKGGNIDINAATLSLQDGTELQTITRAALGNRPAGRGDAGNVNVKVTGAVDIAGEKNGFSSKIGTVMETGTVGNAGNITIDSGSLSLRDGARLAASNDGQGNAGNVNVKVTGAVDIAGRNKNGFASAIASIVGTGTVGNGGNITIDSGDFLLRDGAQLAASTYGQGNAGNVTVSAKDAVSLVDADIFSTVEAGGIGQGGNININAATLSLFDGAQLQTTTYGQGNAGNVTVNAKDAVSLVDAAIFSTVAAGSVGQGGNIDINAATLSIFDGAQLQTITRGASRNQPAGQGDAGNVNIKVTGAVDIAGNKNGFRSAIGTSVETGTVGNGGNITINSGDFSLRDGARLTTSISGQGNAGNVTVAVKDAVSLVDAIIGSTVEAGGVGQGGNIDINAATLSIFDGAQLQTITRGASGNQLAGRGDAGNVNVKVTGAVDIAGKKNVASGIRSSVGTGTVGNGGNITVDSGDFSLRDGAVLTASTLGRGNAGNVTVNAKNAVSLVEAGILSTVEAGGVGKGGNIDINAATLSLFNGAQLQTITSGASGNQPAGRGDAGNVNVKVTGTVDIAGKKNDFRSAIYSSVNIGTVGNGGNITIDSSDFSLRDSAVLRASTSGQGNAGNITIDARDTVNFDNGFAFSSVETTGIGDGGNLKVTTGSLSLTNGGRLIATTLGQGNAGDININARDTVNFDGSNNDGFSSGAFSNVALTGIGNGGNIFLQSQALTLNNGAVIDAQTTNGQGGNIALQLAEFLLLRRDSQISTTAGLAQAGGDGGNITINSPFIIAVPNEDSDITANAFNGKGGNVNINTQAIFGIEARPKQTNQSDITASSDLGVQGQITITQPQVQPPQKLIELPAGLVDASTKFAQICPRGRYAKPLGSFVVTGRGSLPPNTLEPLTGTNNLSPLATLDGELVNSQTDAETQLKEDAVNSAPIVEAQGLVKTADGNIILVAQAPTATPAATSSSAMCPAS